MTWQDLLAQFGTALLIGLFVGIEREQHQARSDQRRFGGVRTFGLLALLGATGGFLRPAVGAFLPAIMLIIIGAALIGFTLMTIWRNESPGTGFATMIAGLVVHLLGWVATTPIDGLPDAARLGLVATIGFGTMAVLSLEDPLHRLAERLDSDDFYATAKLALLLLVVLPILPDEQVGPIEPVNPFQIGTFVAVVAAVGFVGYVAVRVLGTQRGMLLVAGVGGLASSTAVTLDFARRARMEPLLVVPAAVGIGVASTIMFARMLAVLAVVAPGLAVRALPSVGLMGLVAALAVGVAWFVNRRSGRDEKADVGFKNPFAVGSAVRFGLIYMAISIVTFHAAERFGNTGLLASAAISGLADVDAITLALARGWANGETPTDTALTGLVVAAGANTLVKGVLSAFVGSWQLGYRVLGIFAAVLIAGLISVALL